ncbi:MAG: hypothetical protein JW722_00425, partial [Demequinaceae bacterium]|nr:hypothetical protein [Demequinaceae bacterium]
PAGLAGTDFVTATRFYTFGGASVAVRDGATDTLSLLLGDSQGSAQVMMGVALNQDGSMQTASTTDPVTRNAYLPYGATRGSDQLDIEHGWLNQVTDESDTGLIYLNARYYDPILSRFLSPDPLMNPGDPRTLDPYRYADNNPILFQDASGLCSGLVGTALSVCSLHGGFGLKYAEEYRIERDRKMQAAYLDARNGRSDQVGRASRFTADTINANRNSLPQKLIELGSFDNEDISVYAPNRGVPFNGLQAKAAADIPAYLVYAFQNRSGGPWDLKTPLANELDLAGKSHYLQDSGHPGEYLFYDTFGNIELGYMSAKAEISLDEVLELSRLPGAGDQSPADDLATKMGYELFVRVEGREVTAADIDSLIDDYWYQLRDTGNVRNYR